MNRIHIVLLMRLREDGFFKIDFLNYTVYSFKILNRPVKNLHEKKLGFFILFSEANLFNLIKERHNFSTYSVMSN